MFGRGMRRFLGQTLLGSLVLMLVACGGDYALDHPLENCVNYNPSNGECVTCKPGFELPFCYSVGCSGDVAEIGPTTCLACEPGFAGLYCDACISTGIFPSCN